MCVVSKPKVVQPSAAADKDPAILRNPWLDGLDPIIRARQGGVKSLTIRRGGSTANTTPTNPAAPSNPLAPGGSSTSRDAQLGHTLSQLPGALGLAGRALTLKAQK